VGGGSFDATRPDAAFIIQGGDLGAIVRELVDAIRNVKLLSGLWQVVNGHEPYVYLVLSAVHVEACTLHDLTFGQPATTPVEYGRPSLLEHLQANDQSSPALATLAAAERALPADALEASRTIRNRIGAHIDDQMPLNDLMDRLRQFDAGLLNSLVDHLFEALTTSARVDVRLRGILMDDAVMSGLSLTKPPPDSKPYG
jgi:hypothetical protein